MSPVPRYRGKLLQASESQGKRLLIGHGKLLLIGHGPTPPPLAKKILSEI
jgi:hypothetical protein